MAGWRMVRSDSIADQISAGSIDSPRACRAAPYTATARGAWSPTVSPPRPPAPPPRGARGGLAEDLRAAPLEPRRVERAGFGIEEEEQLRLVTVRPHQHGDPSRHPVPDGLQRRTRQDLAVHHGLERQGPRAGAPAAPRAL